MNRSWAGRLAGGAVTAGTLGPLLVLAGWAAQRVHGLLIVVPVQVLLMWWALLALALCPPRLGGRWFRVRGWEPGLYQRLGAYRYMRLLRRIGWERFRQRARGFTGRHTLALLERQTREAESSHLLLAALNLWLLVFFPAWRRWDTALWLVLGTLALHLYPVMLQRALRARLERLLA